MPKTRKSHPPSLKAKVSATAAKDVLVAPSDADDA
jgi:hypothetical protein